MRKHTVHNFGPAIPAEQTVYGASRPGYGRNAVARVTVDDWIDFMMTNSIRRVCCLLSAEQLLFYQDLLGTYRQRFGPQRVCWAPISDFHLAEEGALCDQILPFLAAADDIGEPVVVHCSAGSGRTGHVLSAWLVHRRGMTPQEAADAVVSAGRNPFEAEGRHDAGAGRLYALLAACCTNST